MASSDLVVGAPCWVPDDIDGFTRATLHALDGDSVSICDARNQIRALPSSDVQPCNPDNQTGCKDNTELMCAPFAKRV